MTDEAKPIQVTDSVSGAVTNTIARDLAIAVAAWPVLSAMLGKHDVLAIAQWLASDAGRPVLAIIVPVALTVWRVFSNIAKKHKLIRAARSADDSVAVVIEKPTA